MNTLSYAINFWSQGNIRALFLRHEGYLGAAGAVRMTCEKLVHILRKHEPDQPNFSPVLDLVSQAPIKF